ncbi:unnamed protein product [Leptidea sinapis]|uniref:Uncharacterized protein n=1 Tax=Leptidea sinapis TaxID=189913 RepID=A0A5E4QYC9_9NEOP|nr:unnamed protein product [Leptidea sinapis]
MTNSNFTAYTDEQGCPMSISGDVSIDLDMKFDHFGESNDGKKERVDVKVIDEVEDSQHMSDLLLFEGHNDPQVRGLVRVCVVNYLIGALDSAHGDYSRWRYYSLLPKEEASVIAVEKLVDVLLKGLSDEIHSAVNHTLSALTQLLRPLSYSVHWNLLEDILNALVAVEKNKYWLCRVNLIKLYEKLPFQREYLRRSSQVMSTLYSLLADQDQKVRAAAALAITNIIPVIFPPPRSSPITMLAETAAQTSDVFSFNDDKLSVELVRDMFFYHDLPEQMTRGDVLRESDNLLLIVGGHLGSTRLRTALRGSSLTACQVWSAATLVSLSGPLCWIYATWSIRSKKNRDMFDADLSEPREKWHHLESETVASLAEKFQQVTLKMLNLLVHLIEEINPNLHLNTSGIPIPGSSEWWKTHEPIYMKLYDNLRATYSNYKINLESKSSIFYGFLSTVLNSLAIQLELSTEREFGPITEEILYYLKTIMPLCPDKTVYSVTQLLKCLFGTNMINQYADYMSIDRGTIRHTEKDFFNDVMLVNCFEHVIEDTRMIKERDYLMAMESFQKNRSDRKWSNNKRELERYIRLFEPVVIQSLNTYTLQNDTALQCEVLKLLCQLLALRVNYCMLDSDQVFIGFLIKQLDLVEQHEIPYLIQLCDGLMASGALDECIAGLEPVAIKVFSSMGGVSVLGRAQQQELQATREVLFYMLQKTMHQAKVQELVSCVLTLSQEHPESYYRWSELACDTLLNLLSERSIECDSADGLGVRAVESLLDCVYRDVLLEQCRIELILKILFKAPPEQDEFALNAYKILSLCHESQSGALVFFVCRVVGKLEPSVACKFVNLAMDRCEMLRELPADKINSQLTKEDVQVALEMLQRENVHMRYPKLVVEVNSLAISAFDLSPLDLSADRLVSPQHVITTKVDDHWRITQLKTRCCQHNIRIPKVPKHSDLAQLLSKLSLEELTTVMSCPEFDRKIINKCFNVACEHFTKEFFNVLSVHETKENERQFIKDQREMCRLKDEMTSSDHKINVVNIHVFKKSDSKESKSQFFIPINNDVKENFGNLKICEEDCEIVVPEMPKLYIASVSNLDRYLAEILKLFPKQNRPLSQSDNFNLNTATLDRYTRKCHQVFQDKLFYQEFLTLQTILTGFLTSLDRIITLIDETDCELLEKNIENLMPGKLAKNLANFSVMSLQYLSFLIKNKKLVESPINVEVSFRVSNGPIENVSIDHVMGLTIDNVEKALKIDEILRELNVESNLNRVQSAVCCLFAVVKYLVKVKIKVAIRRMQRLRTLLVGTSAWRMFDDINLEHIPFVNEGITGYQYDQFSTEYLKYSAEVVEDAHYRVRREVRRVRSCREIDVNSCLQLVMDMLENVDEIKIPGSIISARETPEVTVIELRAASSGCTTRLAVTVVHEDVSKLFSDLETNCHSATEWEQEILMVHLFSADNKLLSPKLTPDVSNMDPDVLMNSMERLTLLYKTLRLTKSAENKRIVTNAIKYFLRETLPPTATLSRVVIEYVESIRECEKLEGGACERDSSNRYIRSLQPLAQNIFRFGLVSSLCGDSVMSFPDRRLLCVVALHSGFTTAQLVRLKELCGGNECLAELLNCLNEA